MSKTLTGREAAIIDRLKTTKADSHAGRKARREAVALTAEWQSILLGRQVVQARTGELTAGRMPDEALIIKRGESLKTHLMEGGPGAEGVAERLLEYWLLMHRALPEVSMTGRRP